MPGSVSAGAGSLEFNTAILTDRTTFISSVRDRRLSIFDQVAKDGVGSLAAPLRPLGKTLLRLLGRRSKAVLLLGAELYERRSVTVPLAVLQAVLWLFAGHGLAVGATQPARQVATWNWACMVNIPATLLNLVVMIVHANRDASLVCRVRKRWPSVFASRCRRNHRAWSRSCACLPASTRRYSRAGCCFWGRDAALQNRQGPPLEEE